MVLWTFWYFYWKQDKNDVLQCKCKRCPVMSSVISSCMTSCFPHVAVRTYSRSQDDSRVCVERWFPWMLQVNIYSVRDRCPRTHPRLIQTHSTHINPKRLWKFHRRFFLCKTSSFRLGLQRLWHHFLNSKSPLSYIHLATAEHKPLQREFIDRI